MTASPSYGDRPLLQGGRRSFTPITRGLSVHEKAGLDDSDASAEVFYTHPHAKIFYFSPPKAYIKSTSKEKLPVDTDYPVDTIETLPWRTRVERLLASGKMEIEKVRGSTTFLKCEAVSQAIMRNSQCWCVDGESKFVLRVRQFEYYRIELPSQAAEDKQKVEELKTIFAKLLRFEATPCPFKRAFTVDLPDDAITPRRRGTWTRRDSSQPGLSDSETPSRKPLQNERRVSMRSPPTSFPRNGPNYGSSLSMSRPASSAGFDAELTWTGNDPEQSPASSTKMTSDETMAQGDEDLRSGQADSSFVDTPKREEERGRPAMARQTSVTVPVSVRVASIERSKRPRDIVTAIERKPLSLNTTTTKDISSRFGSITGAIDHNDDTAQLDPVQVSDSPLGLVRNTITESPGTRAKGSLSISDEPVTEKVGECSPPPVSNELPIIDGTATAEPFTEERQQTKSSDVEPEQPPFEQDVVTNNMLEAFDMDVSSDTIGASTTSSVFDGGNALDLTGSQLEEELNKLPGDENQKITSIDPTMRLQAGQDLASSTSQIPQTNDLNTEAIQQPGVDDASSIQENSSVLVGTTKADHEDVSQVMIKEYKPVPDKEENDAISIISSADSFHTLSSNIYGTESEVDPDFDRTPMNQYLDPFARPGWQHQREMSPLTVTGSPAADGSTADNSHAHGADTFDHHHDAASSTTTTTPVASLHPELDLGLRQRLRARRSFSPMPPSSIIITNPSASSRIGNTGRKRELAKAVLQTVLIKPIEIAALMVHILSRIAQGATPNDLFSGELFRRPEHRRRVSGFADQMNGARRNINAEGEDGVLDDDDDNAHNTTLDEDQLDDFAMPIRGRRIRPGSRSQHPNVSYETSFRNSHHPPRDDDAESFLSID